METVPSSMTAVVWEGPRAMRAHTAAPPTPQAGEVLLRVRAVGICGSEISGYLGESSIRVPPLVMGHEFAGTVVGRDAGVEAPALGAEVVVNPLITCGTCRFCSSGHDNLCPERKLIGANRPGAFAEYVAVPATACLPLPGGIGAVNGALAEPLACGVRAVCVGAIERGARVLVIGAGTIGLMCLAALAAAGARAIACTDTNEHRLRTARQFGAEATFDARAEGVVEQIRALTEGYGADAVIDAVGSSASRRSAIEAVRAGGTVVLVGLHDATSPIAVNHIVRQEIRLAGSFAYAREDFARALALLEAGAVRAAPSWLEERPLAACADSFAELVASPTDAAKIMLRP